MVQANNAPQASKTYGMIQDYLDKYTTYGGATPGNIFYVDSGHTNTADTNDGLSKDTPREQIESCFTDASVLVTENNGDIIFAMPGHEETVDAAGDLDLDIAGVTIVFLGEGEAQAKITIGTTSTADVDIDAANITLIRPKFVAEVDALAGAIDVGAGDLTIVDGQYRDGTSIDTTDCIVAGSSATRLKIHGWKYLPGNEAGTEKESNIFLDGVDNAELFDINIKGAFNAACIEVGTDEILNVHMKDIVLNNTDTDPSPGMVLDSNCDGIAERVLIRVASGTTYVSNVSDMNWYESYGTGIDGGQINDPIGTAITGGIEFKIDVIDAYHDVATADTSDNAAMSDVAGNKTDTSSVVSDSASLVAYAKQLLNQHDVATADTSDNVAMSDVVGNKTDAAIVGVVTDSASVMAYMKQVLTTGDSMHNDGANYFVVTASMSSATWNTATAHEIAVVTGVVRLRVVPEVTINLDGAAATIALGTENDTGGWIAATTATALDATELWQSSTIASNVPYIPTSSILDNVVSSDDVGYSIAGGATSAGNIAFHIWWEPLSGAGAVTAGAGGTFA